DASEFDGVTRFASSLKLLRGDAQITLRNFQLCFQLVALRGRNAQEDWERIPDRLLLKWFSLPVEQQVLIGDNILLLEKIIVRVLHAGGKAVSRVLRSYAGHVGRNSQQQRQQLDN